MRTVMTLIFSFERTCLQRVAGIDQPLERVGRDHLDDVGDLHHVEQRRDPRHEILAGGGRRRDDRVIAACERHDQRRQRLRQNVRIRLAVGQQHLGDAIELGRRFGDRARTLARHQHMHVGAERFGGGERLVGGILERLVVVLGDEECCHDRTPASFLSLSTSSATVLTLTPDFRPAGSLVLSTSSRGVMSTP